VILLVVVYIGYWMWTSGSPPAVVTPNKIYFTDDDGKTWFADDRSKLPPFDHAGKPAVVAHVYKCGDKTFVAFLERLTAEAKAGAKNSGTQGGSETIEIKKPLTAGPWVKVNDPRAMGVQIVRCADGTTSPIEIFP
jgi:hypothetical protein